MGLSEVPLQHPSGAKPPGTVARGGSGDTVPSITRVRVQIEGVVQGVGFRPFAYLLATRLGVTGFAANDETGVVIEAEGEGATLARFLDALVREAPPLALIERIRTKAISRRGSRGFAIARSNAGATRDVPISSDVATCAQCLREVFDPGDRRFRYPFTNCTECGPRFSIVTGVPYDRPFTTMATFALCAECCREYSDPGNRRFHAQPLCCPACGPRLTLINAAGDAEGGDLIARTCELLSAGGIVAIKGIGGYHLAARAADNAAVGRLRDRKQRDDKPFAVMVRDLDMAYQLARVGDAEAALLTAPERPIVLLDRLPGGRVAVAVAPNNRSLGLMLPYSALHHLLLAELAEPLVLTSGNVSDEPIAYRDDDARRRLGRIADYFLMHDRAIHVRTDDSVTRVFRERQMPLRRSRGYAPKPLALGQAAERPILACGAELKSTFCLVKGARAFLSHHIGDLENFETLTSFREGIDHYQRLFDVAPAVVAHDLHPEYLSTKYALERDGVDRIGVQHHHAHIAACLAENGEQGPAIGVALDGLGYGLDGTFWGGELLVADLIGFERVGAFESVPLPGGTQAIRQPWRMAASYLKAAHGEDVPADLDVTRRNVRHWDTILQIASRREHSPLTSSAGRLFDAVAALIGVRDVVRYEAQAAIELEQLADPCERGAYEARLLKGELLRLRGADLVAAAATDLQRGIEPATIAGRFHNGLARLVVNACEQVRSERGLGTVALSGGVFQNVLLLRRTIELLEAGAFRVLVHSRVPSNDGGISFGQAAIAAARSPHRPITRLDACTSWR